MTSPADCSSFLEQCRVAATGISTIQIRGRLTRVAGLVMEAAGLKLPSARSA